MNSLTSMASKTFIICLSLLYASAGITQQLDPRLVKYPDLIIVNGNVVSMDDDGVNENVGSTYQALAIRDGRILGLGSTAEIRRMVGPETMEYDVNGRTVIPGIIDTHSHPHESAMGHWGPPREGTYTIEEEEGDTWNDVARKTLELVADLKTKHEPGFWLLINIPRYLESSDIQKDTMLRVHRFLTRHMLDQVNSVQNIYITGNRGVLNTRGMETYGSFFGEGDPDEPYPDVFHDDGITLSGSVGRVIREETTSIPLLMAVIEQEYKEWTAYGITTYGSRTGMSNLLSSLLALDKAGRMPLRYAYAFDSYWFRKMPGHPAFLTDMSGTGSDWLWLNSLSISSGDGAYPLLATTIEARPEIKERELLRNRVKYVKEYAATGLRWANTHVAGDRTLDVLMDMLESGSAEAGMSLDEIRAKRHASDHCRMNPRPDQLPRLKRLNITMSCAPKYIMGDGPDIIKDYGEEYLQWMVPMRTTIEAGVRAVFEIDTHAVAGEGVFFHLGQYVNREGPDGEIFAPEQSINRIWALKTATSWASYYVLKENVLGTLEEGKFADLIVLNKDYFDEDLVPDLKLKTVRPLMTIIGGHLRYLDTDMASELGTEPVGIQPEQVIRQIQQWEAEGV
jgi:predicted amidohydrolase YtcJ